MRWRAAIIGGLAALGAGVAHAQTSTAAAGQPKTPDPAVTSGDKAPVEHLLGDWDGQLTTLQQHGVDVDLSYESETSAVVAGGLKHGVDYAHSINLQVDADMGKLAGLAGFSLHGALIERAGRSASADFLGDHLNQVQEIYGSGGDVGAHLSYLYAEQKLFKDRLDLEAGRLDVGQDFAASPLYCTFMSLMVCPSPRDLPIQTGFTAFPVATWGGRLKVEASRHLALQVGLYQVRPGYGGRSGFDWSTSGSTGEFVPVELDWTPRFGADRLIGHYKLGWTYDTSVYPELGPAAGPAAGTGAAPGRRGRASYYVLADQMVRRTGPNGLDGVILFAGFSHADGRTAPIRDLGFLGITASGVVPGRSGDSIGFQAARLDVSSDLAATQALQADLGEPLSSGLSDVGPPPGVQRMETVLEGRYDVRVRAGLHLMPDLQYVIRPAATRAVPDATVVSLRIKLDL